MTNHRIKVQFNEPVEAYGVELKAHWLGPFTEQMMQETENFKNELGAELNLKPGENPYFAYFKIEFAMKPG